VVPQQLGTDLEVVNFFDIVPSHFNHQRRAVGTLGKVLEIITEHFATPLSPRLALFAGLAASPSNGRRSLYGFVKMSGPAVTGIGGSG
jgi:hypothetical protein